VLNPHVVPAWGFKYSPPHGGPAELEITGWIETQAGLLLPNRYLSAAIFYLFQHRTRLSARPW
jgi:phosphoglucomutase